MGKKLKIDDEIGICLIKSKFLIRNGYFTDSAESGATPFAQLEKQQFDLVLSGFRLKDTNGKVILKKIKSDYPNIQVIKVSGFGDPNLAAKIIDMVANDLINNPIYPKLLKLQ